MVDKSRTVAIVLLAAVAWSNAPTAQAVDPPDLFLEHLAEFVWTGAGGNNTWENSPNWTAPIFPMGYPYPIPTYPNDPGRVDDPGTNPPNTVNITTIYPVVGANLSGAFGADRTVNIDTGNVTVASLKLGGTGVAVTTNVTATGVNRLVFENTELNDTATNPGNPNVMPAIEPEPIWSFNQGRSLIWSTGTAGVGTENRLTAPLQLNDGVDVEGERDLHIYSTIYEGVVDRDGFGTGFQEDLQSSINNLMSGGAKLYLHGNFVTQGISSNGTVTSSDGPGGDRRFGINVDRGILVPPDPQNPPDQVPRQGDVDITGSFQGDGVVTIGADLNNLLPLSNVFLHGDSTGFTGRVQLSRVNLVVDHDKAFGDGKLKQGNPPQGFGFNIISTSDTRKIATEVEMAQWQTIRGADGIAGLEGIGDHSIEFTGRVGQSNTRGFINILTGGKTLTLSGPTYPNIKAENPPGDGRAIAFDGKVGSKTIISGGIHDQIVTGSEDPNITDKVGYLRSRGSGTVLIDGRVFDGMGVQTGFNSTDYAGYTFVEGANLHFRGGQNDAFAGDDLPVGNIVSRGGAVGVDEGVAANSEFLLKLNNSSNPNWDPTLGPFFKTWGNNESIFTTYCTGGLMLGNVGSNEYTQNLNFNSGDLANSANMSLAAHEGGSTYTGTITPNTTVKVNPNTYQLGGGSGPLTLPNANQLTGANHLLVTNGGEVRLQGLNNYTGTTRILRKYLPSNVEQAEASQRGTGGNDDGTVTGQVSTTLTASTLANGGAVSSIGSSSNAAANLVIQGSTLKYVGGAVSTDRLFTVGTSGATLDASGTGALNLTNTSALTIGVPTRRDGTLSTSVIGGGNATVFGQPSIPDGAPLAAQRRTFQTDDLTVGMRVYTAQNDFTPPAGGSPVRITSITNREVMQAGQPTKLDSEEDNSQTTTPNAWPGYGVSTGTRVVQFGPAPARFLTLTGSNVDNNTVAPLIANAAAADIDAAATTPEVATAEAAAGYGTVGIRKEGLGKWILTNSNTYSGATNVTAGTLLVNGNQSGAGLTTVSSGAKFGGTGQIGGSLTMLEGSIFAAIGAGGTLDPLNVLGNIDMTALSNVLSVAGIASGTHTLLTYAGTLVGEFESTPGFTVDYGTGSNSMIQITAVAGLIGDYNNNGTVDAADYTIWRNNVGNAGSTLGANRDPANGSGVVSALDYASWKTNFGNQSGAGAASGLGGGSVPEPTSLLLVGLALTGTALMGRRRS